MEAINTEYKMNFYMKIEKLYFIDKVKIASLKEVLRNNVDCKLQLFWQFLT